MSHGDRLDGGHAYRVGVLTRETHDAGARSESSRCESKGIGRGSHHCVGVGGGRVRFKHLFFL